MQLPSEIYFFNHELKIALYKLEKGDDSDRWLFLQIKTGLEQIEKNAFCGIQIPKRLIPNEYRRKYQIKNLWKYNLSHGWRILYSVQSDKIIVASIIIEWLDHKSYENKFKY